MHCEDTAVCMLHNSQPVALVTLSKPVSQVSEQLKTEAGICSAKLCAVQVWGTSVQDSCASLVSLQFQCMQMQMDASKPVQTQSSQGIASQVNALLPSFASLCLHCHHKLDHW